MKIFSKVASIIRKLKNDEEKITGKELEDRIMMDIRYHQLCNSKISTNKASSILDIVPTKQNTKIIGANWLIDFKNNSHSEHGEDGVIDKIFEILTPENKWVCEFGAHDPENISNTWRLINEENWNAILIEADNEYYEKLKKYYQGNEKVICLQEKISFEGAQKLDEILKNTQIPTNLDLMIIDIDGNDYHVWEAIHAYQPNVLLIEFNASIPIEVNFVQPRDLSINQGSSLRAMVELASKKGYKLVAVTSWNAFFVKNKFFHLFFKDEPPLENMYVFPAKHPISMRAFQLYDGTMVVAPWNEMLWHKVDLKPMDYQVLPESLRSFSRKLASTNYFLDRTGEKKLLDQANEIYLKKIYAQPCNTLSRFANNVFSRYGEDGIIFHLTKVIDAKNSFFVDVGAWDGITFSKSRHLSLNLNWKGLQIESDLSMSQALLNNGNSLSLNVKILCPQEINSLDLIFKKNNVPKAFDLLLLNTYGSEYHLWKNLKRFSPKIVAIQFNPTIPNDVNFIQADDLGINQGCSLRALFDLAKSKNYFLVAVTLETAFFVNKSYLHCITEPIDYEALDLDDIFAPALMHFFQLFDGSIKVAGLDRLLWHGLSIDEDMLQVVPKPLRKFHQFADPHTKQFFYRV